MLLLIWILVAYGMTNILVYGSIFDGPRNFIKSWGYTEGILFQGLFKFISDLISCVMCTSTWVGFFLSLSFFSPVNQIFGTNTWYSIFLDGMLASGAVWGINSIIEFFEENRINKNN